MSIDLDQRAFSFWSDRHRRWAVEAGEFVVAVGRHSRDLPLRASLHVEAPVASFPRVVIERPTLDLLSEQWAARQGR